MFEKVCFQHVGPAGMKTDDLIDRRERLHLLSYQRHLVKHKITCRYDF